MQRRKEKVRGVKGLGLSMAVKRGRAEGAD